MLPQLVAIFKALLHSMKQVPRLSLKLLVHQVPTLLLEWAQAPALFEALRLEVEAIILAATG
jgi:hypothetical protein